MGKYANYDPENDVIFIDYTNTTINLALYNQVVEEVKEICQNLKKPVYELICWEGARDDLSVTDEIYLSTAKEIASSIKGIIRYGLKDPFSAINLRTRTVRLRMQGNATHIYPTREEALAALAKLREDEKAGKLPKFLPETPE